MAFLDWMRFGIRWIIIPLILISVITRVAGAGTVRYRRLVPIYLAAFVLGAVVPHYLVHWVPKLSGFGAQLSSASFRFLLAYLLMITAWVLLGRSVRGEART